VLIDPENNKEAAARMKQMYINGAADGALPTNTGTAVGAQLEGGLPASRLPQPVPIAPAEQLKDVYEGSNSITSGTQSIDNRQLAFRTHDESIDNTGERALQTQTSAQSNTAASVIQQITDAESQKDYTTAANLLRQILPNNLQNFELHHRLAINLMNTGEISEAISEFRIASALCPTKTEYSDDLAAALSIHKKSLVGATALAQPTSDTSGDVSEQSAASESCTRRPSESPQGVPGAELARNAASRALTKGISK
jgi:hypothetical protein